MTIEEIDKLINLYGNLTYNGGAYSQLSGQIERQYIEMSNGAKDKLIEAIIEYGRESAAEAFELGEVAASKLSKEELDAELKRIQNGAKNDN